MCGYTIFFFAQLNANVQLFERNIIETKNNVYIKRR